MEYTDELIQNVAGEIDCGMTCYINLDTFEYESLMSEMHWPDVDKESEEIFKDIHKKVDSWERCLIIEPLESFESFKIMEKFVANCIPDSDPIKKKFWNALERRKPFQNFKYTVDYSDYRQTWFDFKYKQLQRHVRDLIEIKLHGFVEYDDEQE